jgi:hypothetical protein
MRTLIATLVGVALLAAAPHAEAFGPHGGGRFLMRGPGGPGGPGGPPFRLLLAQMTPAQRVQARQILRADRDEMRGIVRTLHEAHEALADKTLAAGTVTAADLTPETQKIAALHQQLLDHGVQVMLKVRALATPEQLAKAAASKQKLDSLHDQIRALLGGPESESELD